MESLAASRRTFRRADEPEKPPCPLCAGSRFVGRDVPLDHPDFGQAFPCECYYRERLRWLQTETWLREYAAAVVNDFSPEVQRLVRPVIKAGVGGVYLSGSPGTGKTHLAAAMTWELWDRLHGSIVSVRPLLNIIRGRFDRESGASPDDLVAIYAAARMLTLDDLGGEYTTPWAVRVLFEIIQRRVANRDRVLTIITSSFDLEELADAYDRMAAKAGSSIASRIVGMCTAGGRRTVIRMKGRDRRLDP